jgi:HSP20 family protein
MTANTRKPVWDAFTNQASLLFVVDLPGVPRDAVQLEIDGDALLVRGDAPAPEGVEAAPTRFATKIPLPPVADTSDVRAEWVEGTLRVHVGRAPTSRSVAIA